MKYNEELLEESKKLSTSYKKSKETNESKQMQKKLIKAMMHKVRNEGSIKNSSTGVVRVKFYSRFFSVPDIGYKEIQTLILKGEFEALAREYCMYLADQCLEADEYKSAYYEIAWDYKTYLDGMKSYKDADSMSVSLKRKATNK